MTVSRTCSAVAIAVAISLHFACPALAPPPTAPTADATHAARTDPQPPARLPSPTAVKAPVFSTDPCEKDEDCAPVAKCHPDKCVSRANAGTMPPDLMCTMECRGGTVDCGYNRCGCARSPSGKKLCALLPGGAER
jgi:hypothetical protein